MYPSNGTLAGTHCAVKDVGVMLLTMIGPGEPGSKNDEIKENVMIFLLCLFLYPDED